MSERRSPEVMREAEMPILKKLTDEALVLKPKFERLPLAVFRILDNHGYKDAERTRMYKAIMNEMTRRSQAKAKTVREVKQMQITERENAQNKPASTPTRQAITPQMLRDARAHELRQPEDSYEVEAAEKLAHELGLPLRKKT